MNIILMTPHQKNPKNMDPGHTTAEAVNHATRESRTAAIIPFQYVALKHNMLRLPPFSNGFWSCSTSLLINGLKI